MRKMFRFSSFFLVLVVILICVSGAASPVHAIGLDPVSFLYPIWQAYGMANGITVTTIGGDQFTQQGFNGLFDEWQQSEVSQGVQSTVQTLSDFVNTISGAVSVVPGQASVSGLLTKLRLGSQLVGKLARFWNWIIVDKLGGSSHDAVDFNSSSGNLYETDTWIDWPYVPWNQLTRDYIINHGIIYAQTPDGRPCYGIQTGIDVELFVVGISNQVYTISQYSDVWWYAYNGSMTGPDGDRTRYTNSNYPGLYWNLIQTAYYGVNNILPVYPSLEAALADVYDYINNGPADSGSLTVTPEIGVDTLGFPDTSQPNFVPADTNIGWNIPYDEGADTNDYLDDAYQKSLDNDLQLDDQISDSPVTGSGEVGSVGEYVTPGLAEVFPFCIPFDIYRFFTLLVAEPVAPSWTAQLAFPEELGGTQSVTIDLNSDTWNNLAAIVRTMELLAFIIGLAYVTRSMFIRG